MARNYVSTIAAILINKFSMNVNDARSLAWAGLEGSTYFQNLPMDLKPTNQFEIQRAHRRNANGIGQGCN